MSTAPSAPRLTGTNVPAPSGRGSVAERSCERTAARSGSDRNSNSRLNGPRRRSTSVRGSGASMASTTSAKRNSPAPARSTKSRCTSNAVSAAASPSAYRVEAQLRPQREDGDERIRHLDPLRQVGVNAPTTRIDGDELRVDEREQGGRQLIGRRPQAQLPALLPPRDRLQVGHQRDQRAGGPRRLRGRWGRRAAAGGEQRRPQRAGAEPGAQAQHLPAAPLHTLRLHGGLPFRRVGRRSYGAAGGGASVASSQWRRAVPMTGRSPAPEAAV